MEHILFKSMPYEAWQQLQHTGKRNLVAVFAANPKVDHLERYLVRLGGTADRGGNKAPSFATAKINFDDTVTYSPAQWAAFQ